MKNLQTLIITVFCTLLLSANSYSQLFVNDVNLNKSVISFELHLAKKPFTSKECVYIDYGQKEFKECNYDVTKGQSIYDSAGIKFEKGDYVRLKNYLKSTGWIMEEQRITTLGNVLVNIISYKKKE